jgi:predicted dehydrogenase
MAKKIRMGQYGTKHGHAGGKLQSMKTHAEVELAGVYEPDGERRKALEKTDGPFAGVHWFASEEEMLGDDSIVAIASEGLNVESLEQTQRIVEAGRHVWYDKPAGDHWALWQKVVAQARKKNLLLQMGYMFRYHDGFQKIGDWARSGLLGQVFCLRAHMSTNIPPPARQVIGQHRGGIFYDLGGHMLDQVVWILGRPEKVTAFLRNDSGVVPQFSDNTLGVFEYEKAMAWVDIAAMEPRPMARRFEVYGSQGSALLLEPFEPGHAIRLCLEAAAGGFKQGEQRVPIEARSRQKLYDLELESFLAAVRGEKEPDRSLDHELLVQETLLRATGGIKARGSGARRR